jgi:hypothetical membrane protein
MTPTTDDQVLQARTERRRLRPRLLAAAGALLVLAGFISLLGIITAEALYPEVYTTVDNAISDLGATAPPDSVIYQPSARIFNTVMIVTGLLVIAAAVCVERGFRRVAVAVFTGLTGLGMLGVGLFPGNYGTIHALFALLTFFAGGIAAIVSATVQRPPLSVISTIFGIVTLGSLILYMVLGDSDPMAGLGIGGVERWIAYPIVAWTMAFGGYLLGRAR